MSFFGTISSKEHNSLRLIIQLSQSYENKKPVSLSEISQEEGISIKYLEQLIMPFKKAGMIKSQRGRAGGYIMVKDPKKISLKEIIWLINDNPSLAICLDRGYKKACDYDHNCVSKNVWGKIQTSMEDFLSQITLHQIINH
ncbi:MAG: Rrf2 family transcriptional regulator [Candidatus Buchananbacteria bacterium]|nr:Rrf2 family transcriptional regulator [Candidatus Buchananbacteria bacterium]